MFDRSKRDAVRATGKPFFRSLPTSWSITKRLASTFRSDLRMLARLGFDGREIFSGRPMLTMIRVDRYNGTSAYSDQTPNSIVKRHINAEKFFVHNCSCL